MYRYRERLQCVLRQHIVQRPLQSNSRYNPCGSGGGRVEIYKVKSAANCTTGHFRRNTITEQQRRWNNEERGRWTAGFIPYIRPWIGRKFGELNYFVIQMLSCPGYFRKTAFPCWYKEGEIIDDAEHNVFESACWPSYRSVMTSIIGTNIVRVMLRVGEIWLQWRITWSGF